MDTRNIQYMLGVVAAKGQVTGGDAVYLLQEVLKAFSASAGGIDKLSCAPGDAAALSALLNGLTRLAAVNSTAFSAGGQRQRLEDFSQKAKAAEQSLEEVAQLAKEAAETEEILNSRLQRLEPERGALLLRQEENERKRRRIAQLEDGGLDRAAAEASELDRRCAELEQEKARWDRALAEKRAELDKLEGEIQRLSEERAEMLRQESALADMLAKQKSAAEQSQARTEKVRRQLEEFEASRTEIERRQQEEAARAEAFSKAWQNLWQRNEQDRARYLEQVAARLPDETVADKTGFPAAVQADLDHINHWLEWVREQLKLGITCSEEMMARRTEP